MHEKEMCFLGHGESKYFKCPPPPPTLFFLSSTYRHMNYLNIAESGVKYHSPDISIDCQTLPCSQHHSKEICIQELVDSFSIIVSLCLIFPHITKMYYR